MSENNEEYTTELVHVAQPTNRTVDLRNRATDSWTDVLDDTIMLSRGICNTEFVPKGLRGSEAKVTAAMLYGRELGLPPMTGLGSIDVIEGKAAVSAEMQRALILQAGHELQIAESTREKCVIRGRRKGSEEWTTATWTIQEAGQTQVFISKDKGWGPLSAKTQWRSWPTEMLLARATTRLARMIFPDVVHGMRSTEELQDMQQEDAAGAVVVEQMPEPSPVQRRRVAPRTPQARAAEVAQPAPVADPEPVAQVDELPAEPVQRARAPRPQPRGQKGQEVEAGSSQPEIVDAEVVEEVKAPPSKGVGLVQAHWKRLGVDERAERLWYASVIVGREISSHNELGADELHKLMATLERAKTIDAINALVDQSGAIR